MSLIIVTSVLLSIIQSILFWNKTPGISVPIFTILSLVVLIYILEKNKKIKNQKAIAFIIPIVLLSSTYFLYNNRLFKAINGFAIVGLFIIMCIYLTKSNIKLPKFLYKIISIIFGTMESIDDVMNYFKKLKINVKGENNKKVFKVIKAILVSLPIVLVVLLLLMSADSIFANLFKWIFDYIGKLIRIDGGVKNILRKMCSYNNSISYVFWFLI